MDIPAIATQPITIHVDESAARVFKDASPEERRKLEALLSLQLLDAGAPGAPLSDLMRLISERAQAHGLTEEKPQELLAALNVYDSIPIRTPAPFLRSAQP